jgi:hypothetical protein
MQLGLGLMLALGLVGGLLAWRGQTRRMRWRSPTFDESPTGMSPQAYRQRRNVRARVKRLVVTATWSLVGMLGGLLLALAATLRS